MDDQIHAALKRGIQKGFVFINDFFEAQDAIRSKNHTISMDRDKAYAHLQEWGEKLLQKYDGQEMIVTESYLPANILDH